MGAIEQTSPAPRLLRWEDPATFVAYQVGIKKATIVPSPHQAFAMLCQVQHAALIDSYGKPPMAATSHPENSDNEHLSLYNGEATLFGRDSLIQMRTLMRFYPRLGLRTLVALAQRQATVHDEQAESERVRQKQTNNENPIKFSEARRGGIHHEDRDANDPIAKKLPWEFPYYGSADATPLYILTMHEAYKILPDMHILPANNAVLDIPYTDRDGQLQTLRHSLEESLLWIRNAMDEHPEGLIEFKKRSPYGLPNQDWRDSWDSHRRKDGSIANSTYGIAALDVNVLAYQALVAGITMLGPDNPHRQEDITRAEALRKAILTQFKSPEPGVFYASALERVKRKRKTKLNRLDVKTSALFYILPLLTGEENRQEREAIIYALCQEDMINASGILTVSRKEKGFRPQAYHYGNVWTHDTHEFARTLLDLGYPAIARVILEKIPRVNKAYGGYPEFARGDEGSEPTFNTAIEEVFDRRAQRTNRLGQPAQEIQGFSVQATIDAEDILEKMKQGTIPSVAQDEHNRLLEKEIVTNVLPLAVQDAI